MKQHISYFDFLRGVAILMVVAIHTYIAGDFTSIDGCIRIVFRQLLNCAVPIFLALSGFFLGRKTFQNRDSVLSFWEKQIPKVYIPCIVWSIPLFCMSISGGVNYSKSAIYMIVCGYSIYYFIALIIQYYILLPLLQKHLKRNLIISMLVSSLSILFVTYMLSVKEWSLPLIFYAGPFVVWFVFYMLGVYFANKVRSYTLTTALLITITGFLLECVETYILQTYFSGGVGIKLSAFIYSFGIILLVLHPKMEKIYRENRLTSLVVYIGKFSFAIYLIHCYIISIVDKFFVSDSWFLSWLLVSLITISIIAIVRRILPQKVNKYIGFS